MGLKLKIHYDSLDDFYRESNSFDDDNGNKSAFKDITDKEDISFRGLSREEIEKSKYSYKKGLDTLEEIEGDLFLGGRRKEYEWDETDGDEMSMERFYDGNDKFMQKRRFKSGSSKGKFVTVYVNVVENCGVGHKAMVNKALTAIKIVDFIESQGYKVQVVVIDETKNLGIHNNQNIDFIRIEVVIKKFEEALIKSTILACVTPWFLRWHLFKFVTAKFKTGWGLGSPYHCTRQDTLEEIYIGNGQCLTEQSSDDKIKSILNLFEKLKEKEYVD